MVVLGGRYRLIEMLGQGGMGEVWRGVDTELDRAVAVKTIRLAGGSDAGYDEMVKRFRREAKAVAALNHPNIVTAHDFGVHGTGAARVPYLVMEFIEGRSTAAEIDERVRAGRGGLPVDRVVAIGLDVCAGLAAAHRAGLVHRDLKPANLMVVAGSGQVKIVDFGIARSADLSRLTGTGGLVGTVPYMAPEQVVGGVVDGRTDLYALGCVLFELLTGESPFVATEPAALLYAHVNVEPRPLRRLRADAPAGLEALLRELLAKTAGQRPRDADAVAARLRPFGGPVVTKSATAPPAPPRPATAPQPRVVPPHPSAADTAAARGPTVRPQPTDRRWRRRILVGFFVLITLTLATVAVVTNLPDRHGAAGQPRASRPPASTGSGTPTNKPTNVKITTPLSAPHQIATLTGHTGYVHSVAFSADGKTLATADYHMIRLWKVATHTLIATFPAAGYSMALSPDGKTLASGGESTIRLWRVATRTLIATITGHFVYVNAMAFSPDGKTLASGDNDDYMIRLWNVATHTLIATFANNSGDVNAMAFSPDGKILASGSGSHIAQLWNVATHTLIVTFTNYGSFVNSVAFSPDGTTLASGSADRTVLLWNVATHALIATLTTDSDVTSVAFSPDGRVLASGGYDHMVRLWNVATHALIATLAGHTNFVDSVAFSPDGKILASGSTDRTVRLWQFGGS